MSRIIKSPVKKWPGEVVFSDPLTFPQVIAFETAIMGAKNDKESMTSSGTDNLTLPGVLACVEEFRLDNFPSHPTVDNFPATPRLASNQLIAWLIGEIVKLYNEAEEIPNA